MRPSNRFSGSTRGLILLLSAVCLLLTFFVLSTTWAQDPGNLDSLWVAAGKAIVKVDVSDGSVLLQIHASRNIRAVAVDNQREILWAFDGRELSAFKFEGDLQLNVPVDQENDDGDDDDDDDDDRDRPRRRPTW